MKKFIAVYTGTTAARNAPAGIKLSDADRSKREREGINAWMAWGEKHKAAIVYNGGRSAKPNAPA